MRISDWSSDVCSSDLDPSTDDSHSGNMERKMYLRFAAMIVTGMVVMYWVMFVGSYEWSHIRFSQSRVFMALVMGGTMGLVMLGWMLNMYKNTRSEEHTSELQSLMRISYAVFCLKKKKQQITQTNATRK